jgi:hypothetical protein
MWGIVDFAKKYGILERLVYPHTQQSSQGFTGLTMHHQQQAMYC